MAFTEVISLLFRSQGTGKVKRDVKSIESSMTKAGGAVKSMLGPLAGIGAAYAFTAAAKKSMEFDKALTQLSIQGHLTGKGQADLRRQILKTATATGVSRDALREYAQGVTDATGNVQLAQDAMTAVAKAAQVTGADLNGLGTLVSDASMKFNILGKDAGSALSIMIQQGEMGRYTLNEMARTGATAMSVAGIAGMEGADGLREMGAMMQIIRQGFGSAEEAATGFKTMVTKLYGPETERKLAKLGEGISIRGKSGELRKFGDIFLDVLRESKGDAAVLTDIFGTRGILGTANFAKIMRDNGGSVEAVTKELNRFRNVSGSGRDLHQKYNRMLDSGTLAGEKLSASWEKFVSTAMSERNINTLAEAIDNLSISMNWTADMMDEWRNILGYDKPKKKTDEEMAKYSQAGRGAAMGAGGQAAYAALSKIFHTDDVRSFDLNDQEKRAALTYLDVMGKTPQTAGMSEDEKLTFAIEQIKGNIFGGSKEYREGRLRGEAERVAERLGGSFGLSPLATDASGTLQFGQNGQSVVEQTQSAPAPVEVKLKIFDQTSQGVAIDGQDGNGGVFPSLESL